MKTRQSLRLAATFPVLVVGLSACTSTGNEVSADFISAAEARGFSCSTTVPADTGVKERVLCENQEQETLDLARYGSETERDRHWSSFVNAREHWHFVSETGVLIGSDPVIAEQISDALGD